MAVTHFETDDDPIPCGVPASTRTTDELNRVTCQRCRQTKYFRQCEECWEREMYEHDEADYLRAAARYDGSGRDWR